MFYVKVSFFSHFAEVKCHLHSSDIHATSPNTVQEAGNADNLPENSRPTE